MKKGYKLTNVQREKKIGVAAGNIDELIEKSLKKFGVCAGGSCQLCVAEDGTIIEDDDYLQSLPPQTLLVLLKNGENMVTDFEFYYNMIRSTKKDYIDTGNAAKDFLTTNIKEKFKVFQKYIVMADNDRALLSSRTEDPAWFEGLDPSEKTKEQSMGKRVKDRMRGYFYKTKSALQSSDLYVHSKHKNSKVVIDQLLLDLRKTLELNTYNSVYFNRKVNEDLRLCNDVGLFECGGLWNNAKCAYDGDHAINPYRSKEERIIFQTWNLDHRIEISRTIIPKILEAIESICNKNVVCIYCDKNVSEGCIETDRYYLQLFTTENLKLVHIVCHCKSKHNANSDVYTVCKKCFGIQAMKGG